MAIAGNRRLLVVHADGPDGPSTSPGRVGQLLNFENYDLLTGWVTRPHAWLADGSETGFTVMASAAMSKPVNDGLFQYLPVRQSAIPRLFHDIYVPDVVVVAGVRRGNKLAFRGSVGWAPAACELARSVVVEVAEDAPDIGAPLINGPVSLEIPEPTEVAVGPTASRDLDEIDLAVGQLVAQQIPADATIQIGPGAIAEATLRTLQHPVGVFSGLVSDAVAELLPRGLLIGNVRCGYVFGGDPVQQLADAGRLDLLPVEQTHDLEAVSAIPRFVAINAALQVGLDGSVNVERIGQRTFSGIGGHPDYCAAASRSRGGLSIIALRSTTRSGKSTIVPNVHVVSTTRADIDMVITEHGVADLRGVGDAERRRRLLAITDPSVRAELTDGP